MIDAAEREHDEPKPRYRDPDDTQPLSKRDLRNLREQMAAELSEFRANTPTPKVSTIDVRAREARIAEQEARRRAREKERNEATQEIMNDIRAQLDDD